MSALRARWRAAVAAWIAWTGALPRKAFAVFRAGVFATVGLLAMALRADPQRSKSGAFRYDPRMARLARPVRSHWLMGTGAMALAAMLMALEPLVGRAMIDEALAQRDPRLFLGLLAMLAAIAFLALVFESVGAVLVGLCQESVRMRLQAGFVSRLFRMTTDAPSDQTDADFQALSAHGARETSVLVTRLPAQAIAAAVQIAVTALLLTLLQPMLGVATIVAAGMAAWISANLSERIETASTVAREADRATSSRLSQLFSARSLFRQHYRAPECLDSLARATRRSRNADAGLALWKTVYRFEDDLWGLGFTAAVLLITGLGAIAGKLSLGECIAISIFAGRIQAPMRLLPRLRGDVARAAIQFARVADLEEGAGRRTPARTVDGPEASWSGPIVADAVWFARLKGAAFRIEQGSKTLFAGSGAGDVLDLLAGARPDRGTVTAGAAPLAEMPSQVRRGWAARIAAEPRLIPGTLLENICFATDPPEQLLQEALAAVGLSKYVAEQGLGTMLDPAQRLPGTDLFEDDVALRHRIQVARALVLRPKLLLVEDFCGALDRATALELLRALDSRATTLVAAGSRDHLLNLVDHVVWIEDGVCQPRQAMDELLLGHRAADLIAPGYVQRALQSRGALLHASHRARRDGVPLLAVSVELFGNGRRVARLIEHVADTLKDQVREVELVLLADRARLRCVLLGKNGLTEDLERRLVACVGAALERQGAEDVYFRVAPEDLALPAAEAA